MSLAKLNIMVTRPGIAGIELCALIESHGGKAIHFPTIQFAPPDDEQAFSNALATINEHNWLIFISPQAVQATLEKKIVFSKHLKLAAIGKGTAQRLQKAGYGEVYYPANDWSSEGLLALNEFQSIAGKKIGLVRGAFGRDVLAKTFITRGATVTHIIAYQRKVPATNSILAIESVNMIICTSFEAVQNLKKILSGSWQKIRQIPLIVVSERIKILAQALDFQTIWVAPNASHYAILQELEGLNYVRGNHKSR